MQRTASGAQEHIHPGHQSSGVSLCGLCGLSAVVGLTTVSTLVSETGLLRGWLSDPISRGSSCPSDGQGLVPVHLAAKPGSLRAGSQPAAEKILILV